MPGTVSVASKHPAGLHLRLFTMGEVHEQVMGGGLRKVQRASFSRRFTIRGTGRRVDDPTIMFGYAITPDVDADFFAEWLKQNADSDLVKNRIIFSAPRTEEVKAEARDNEETRSGLEPLDPTNVPSEFKRKISTAERPSQS